MCNGRGAWASQEAGTAVKGLKGVRGRSLGSKSGRVLGPHFDVALWPGERSCPSERTPLLPQVQHGHGETSAQRPDSKFSRETGILFLYESPEFLPVRVLLHHQTAALREELTSPPQVSSLVAPLGPASPTAVSPSRDHITDKGPRTSEVGSCCRERPALHMRLLRRHLERRGYLFSGV